MTGGWQGAAAWSKLKVGYKNVKSTLKQQFATKFHQYSDTDNKDLF
jgi:hypothetical protein